MLCVEMVLLFSKGKTESSYWPVWAGVHNDGAQFLTCLKEEASMLLHLYEVSLYVQ